MEKFNDFYRDKNVLITGHTGFKGSWLSIWLNELGANVIGYALDPYTNKDNFILSNLNNKVIDIRGDLRNKEKLREVFKKYEPEVVFHLAAQPLVRLSYEIPVETYEVNLIGTLNVLECIRKSKKTQIGIMVTTDKCYENKEKMEGYKETDPMGGYDPYSSSKGCAELAISSWRRSFFNTKNHDKHKTSIASVRAGNVIGGGDWSKDRIIPDCVNALEKGKEIEIRSPKAIRPWQHVLEPLYGYLMLGQRLFNDPIKFSGGWNFGPEKDSIINVWSIAKKIIKRYGKGNIKDISDSNEKHEANILTLNISKAKSLLEWNPVLDIDQTIDFTVEWYKKYKTKSVYELCVDQINRYCELRD